MNFPQLFKSWILIALGVLLASNTSQGIAYDSNGALIVAVILLSLCNVFFKPLLMLFSLPFIILTFGIGVWLINALLFLLVGGLVEGFHVASFGSALWGALVVSITSAVANLLFGKNRVKVQMSGTRPQQSNATGGGDRPRTQQTRRPLNDDDVIDI
ncbi:MAG TPA: phage holin family protein [Opitutae bacterium]|nr:phage holin family protein [Opitutae bacterium]